MTFSLSRWRPKHLVLSWLSYWAALAIIKLGPAAIAARTVANGPSGAGTATINGGSDGFSAVISQYGETLWSGAVTLPGLALWLAGPPILIWLLWFVQAGNDRRAQVSPAELAAPDEVPADAGRIPTPEGVMRPPRG